MIRFVKYGKGGGGGSSTEVDIPEVFKPYLVGDKGVLNEAQNLYQTGGFGVADKAGSTTQKAWQSGLDLATTLGGLNPDLIKTFQGLQSPGKMSGDLLDANIAATVSPLRDQYTRVAIPSIEDAAAAAGMYGSSRQGIAEGLAKSELDKAIANIDASMRYQATSDDLNRQLQGNMLAAQFAPNLYNLLGSQSNVLSSVGQQQDYFTNLQNKSDLNNLLNYGAYIQQFIPGTLSSATSTSGGGSNKFGGALAGAGTGAMIGSAVPGVGTAIGAGVGALAGLLAG